MASLSELMVSVGADISDFTRGMKKVDKDIQGAGKTFGKMGKSMSSAGKAMTASITAPLMGIGVTAVTIGATFDKQMSNVAAVTGATGKEFDSMRSLARDLGSTTMFSAKEASTGMEMLGRAGWSTQEIMSGLPSVLNLATASNTDLATTADIASNIMSGFGIEANKAGKMADVLAKTTATANTDMSQLGDAMKYVAPVASGMGWSIEETASAIGKMSDAGIQGSQAGTALRGGLTKLANPSKEARSLMDKLSISVFDAQGNMKSMPEVLKSIEQGTKGMTDKQKAQTLATMFGQEAMSGWQVLLDQGSEKMSNYTGELKKSKGQTSEMAKVMSDNAHGAFKKLGSALSESAISISDVLTPAIRKITDGITSLTNKFNALSPSTKTAITILAGLTAMLPPLLMFIGFIAQGVGALVTVFGMVSAPVLAIVAGIALLVAGLAIAYAKIEPFREIVNRTFTQAKELIVQAINTIVTFLREKLAQIKQFWKENGESILQAIKNVWNAISPIVNIALKATLAIVKYIWNSIKGVIDGALNIIMGLIKTFAGLFTGDFSKMWEGIKQLFGGAIKFVWNLMNLSFVGAIRKLVVNFVKTIVKLIKGKWDSIRLAFSYGKDKVVSLMDNMWALIKVIVSKLKNGVINSIKALWNTTKGIFNSMKSGVSNIFNGIKSTASSVWNGIKSTVTKVASSLWNGIKTTFNTMKSTIRTIFNGIKSTASTVWNGIKKAITSPIESAKKTVLGIIDKIKNAFNLMKIKIPKPKLPSISVTKKKGIMGIPYPDFNVNWNAKGAIFNGASVLGGGQGVGEAGAEAVLPIQHKRYMKPFASAVADNMESMKEQGEGKVEQNFHFAEGAFVVREEADIDRIARKLLAKQKRTNRWGGR
ncbi:phage tail tape measure protein [Thalassobacillus sp. CUG 92003]|uniref:phage tail tape measure protein n=1 Tax=Thalassobacillus sp. CUG 92003 TaxID=2736641 RepID=UPI0015E68E32|nr:phage tail tape measure protein [Thalassobacillus sp. CUG 92003]